MRMFVATWALMVCHVAGADGLCGLPDDARVVATIRYISLSEWHEKQWAEHGLGRWKALTADSEDYLDHSEEATWDQAFGGQVPLPEAPYCRYPSTRKINADVELRVYRLEGKGLPTFRADALNRLHGVYVTSGGSPSKYELVGEVTFVDLGGRLCGIPDDAQVVATIRAIAVPEYLEEVIAQEGRWSLLSARRNDTSAHTENARWDHTFGGRTSLPDSPYCRYPRIERGFGNVQELRVYRLEGDDLPTISASDLFDFYFLNADQRKLASSYELLGDPSDWIEESPVASPVEVVGHQDHFLAVATSPDAGTRIAPGESGYYGIGWHTESQHDAGLTATVECRKQGGGSACFSNASGKSLRGGCVGVATATWRDRDKDTERAYVVTSSSFRDVIARDLSSGCLSTAFGGKYENTVVEHSCEIVRIMCAGDATPADRVP